MKHKNPSLLTTLLATIPALMLFFAVMAAWPVLAQDEIKQENIIFAVQANSIDVFDRLAGKLQSQQKDLINQLVDIFKNAQSPILTKGSAAYCLGELRASEAANALALGITLEINSVSNDHLTVLQGPVAMKALIKIGNPSIPAVMRNLTESDDAKVRELSLKVLCRIDGDKDITQLRLQKVLAIEKDAHNQTRLQIALEALPEISLEK